MGREPIKGRIRLRISFFFEPNKWLVLRERTVRYLYDVLAKNNR